MYVQNVLLSDKKCLSNMPKFILHNLFYRAIFMMILLLVATLVAGVGHLAIYTSQRYEYIV